MAFLAYAPLPSVALTLGVSSSLAQDVSRWRSGRPPRLPHPCSWLPEGPRQPGPDGRNGTPHSAGSQPARIFPAAPEPVARVLRDVELTCRGARSLGGRLPLRGGVNETEGQEGASGGRGGWFRDGTRCWEGAQ